MEIQFSVDLTKHVKLQIRLPDFHFHCNFNFNGPLITLRWCDRRHKGLGYSDSREPKIKLGKTVFNNNQNFMQEKNMSLMEVGFKIDMNTCPISRPVWIECLFVSIMSQSSQDKGPLVWDYSPLSGINKVGFNIIRSLLVCRVWKNKWICITLFRSITMFRGTDSLM